MYFRSKSKLVNYYSLGLDNKPFPNIQTKLNQVESEASFLTHKTIETSFSPERLTRSLAVGSPIKNYQFISLELDPKFSQECAYEY